MLGSIPQKQFVIKANPAVLSVKGKDARVFLHRMSTNSVEDRKFGESFLNCFVNAKGRIVDVVTQYHVADDHLLLFSSLENASKLTAWLDQYLFAEDVTLSDRSRDGSCAIIWGVSEPFAVEIQRQDRVVVPFFDLGYLCWDPNASKEDLDVSLSALKMRSADSHDYDGVCVLLGIPRAPQEISEQTNPLEIGLHRAIHWSKGCYIGQEVISRIETYQKNSKHLVRVFCKTKVAPGTQISMNGSIIGAITSTSNPISNDAPCALAIVKGEPETWTQQKTYLALDAQNLEVRLDMVRPSY